jgi:predicted nucleic-acid-binding protein
LKAIDTNVLVRYVVTGDDLAQSAAARRLIEDECSPANPALASPVVLAEFVWVLRSRYKFAKTDIVSALDALAKNPNVVFDTEIEFLTALEAYRGRRIDFADCLIAARARSLSAGPVLTFDGKAARHSPFLVLLVSGA